MLRVTRYVITNNWRQTLHHRTLFFSFVRIKKIKITMSSASLAPLIITSTSNLISDEKRDLFFNVDRTLEIPMEDFNNEWWPLVSNIWTK